MAQRLMVLVLLVLSTMAAGGPAQAQEQELVFKKVAVFPFAVTSKESLGYLGEKVSQEIRDRLKTDGFTPISQEDLHKELSQLTSPVDEAQAQAIGRKLGADMVIWGTLLKVGDLFSLEGHVLDLSGRKGAVLSETPGDRTPLPLRPQSSDGPGTEPEDLGQRTSRPYRGQGQPPH